MLFCSKNEKKDIYDEDNRYIVKEYTEVETVDGFKYADKLTLDDKLLVKNDIKGMITLPIKAIESIDHDIIIEI